VLASEISLVGRHRRGSGTARKSERSFLRPRASEAHHLARRQQILDAARRCVARRGFVATSIRDLHDEAGPSTGAVHGTSSGKEEIAQALAGDVLARVTDWAEELAAAEDPLAAVEALVRMRVAAAAAGPADEIGLRVQAWGRR
jgi:AcrR family transcriptional regulator